MALKRRLKLRTVPVDTNAVAGAVCVARFGAFGGVAEGPSVQTKTRVQPDIRSFKDRVDVVDTNMNARLTANNLQLGDEIVLHTYPSYPLNISSFVP